MSTRWRCSNGCHEAQAVVPVRVSHLWHYYIPMVAADDALDFDDPGYRRRVKVDPQYIVAGPPLCRACHGELVREGRCQICHTNQALEFFVPPPDFDPELDDVDVPNICATCHDKLDLDSAPILPSVPQPPEKVSAELYEQRIRDARGRPPLRRALIRAAMRDHPYDPRWTDFIT